MPSKSAKTPAVDTPAADPVSTAAPVPAPAPAAKAAVKATKATKAKTTKPAKPAPATAVDKAAPKAKPASKAQPKEKLVRDSFTMPQADFALIAQLKARALGFQRPVKKSELLRAGLQALAALNDEVLQAVLAQLPQIKTGRPRKAD